MLLKNSFIAAFLLACSFFSSSILAQAFNVTEFDIYYDDSAGNKGDIYLHSPERFVPIGINIMVPILLPSKGTVVFDKDQNELDATTLTPSALTRLIEGVEKTDYFFEDVNADGALDVRIYNQTNDGSGIVVYGNASSGSASATAFDFTNAPHSARFASSSQLRPSHGGVKIFTATESNVDIVSVVPPNSSGVSVNSFERFTSTDRPIRINNSAGYYTDNHGVQRAKDAATSIVVIADEAQLKHPIEILGASADLIILTPSESGTIHCENCVFKNVNKISLITAVPSVGISAADTSLGILRPGLQSSINISNLNAPGAITLEIVTQSLEISGVVDTHLRAVANGNGGFTELAQGDKLIGSAQTNMLLGQLLWDYQSGQVVKLINHNASFRLTGDFYSTAVNIVANGDFSLAAFIDTRADVVATADYQGAVYVPSEGITISVLGENRSLLIGTDSVSNGEIAYQATGNVKLLPTIQPTSARRLSVIAGKTIYNYANLAAQNLSLSGHNIFNEGKLTADIQLDLFAQNTIANQYGGHVSGRAVNIVSIDGVVRNGSRTPYISLPFEIANVFSFENVSSWADQDITQQGIFYTLFSSVLANTSGLNRPEKNTAYIVADQLKISTPGFENINPYYLRVNQPTRLDIAKSRLNQVVVSAESSLVIAQPDDLKSSTDYILNSSAYIVLNNPEGTLRLDAGTVLNERYRVATTLESDKHVSNYQIYTEDDTQINLSDVEETQSASVVVYSTPARIVSMGSALISAERLFTNNMSYVEIFKDAKVVAPYIESLGVESQGMVKTASDFVTYNSLFDVSNIDTNSATVSVDPQQLDSLFYVQGNYDAQESYLSMFKTTNLLDYYAGLAVADIVLAHESQEDKVIRGQVETENYGGDTESIRIDSHLNNYQASVDVDSSKNTITLERTHDKKTVTHHWENASQPRVVSEHTTQETDVKKLSLWNSLRVYQTKIADKVSALLDEIMWWGEDE